MKKFFISIILVFSIVASAFALVACNDNGDDTTTPPPTPVFDFTKPADLPDYGLTIEWIGLDGNATTFIKNRPTAIIFNGESDYNRKEVLNLDPEIYNSGVIKANATLQQTSYFWYRQGFNVGIFHYENFADDTTENVNKKIYNSSAMTYINKDGNTVTTTPDFNLTEAFISAWLKTATSDDLALSGGKYLQEVRFIGNGVGACLALSCADYLNYLYENGWVGVGYLADRIDIIDPYFSNAGTATVVDFYDQTTLGSALAYNAQIIKNLTAKGVVMDMVESDAEFYDSYDSRYTGVSIIDGNVTLTNEGDSALYLQIKECLPYVNFNETFSEKLPETYRKYERSTLDWWLYTINGSDLADVSTQSETDIRPMIDGFNKTGTAVSSSVKYAVTAWTPTIYLRAVRGHEYRIATYNKTTGKETAKVIDRFQAESYQISDISIDDTYSVCGYVYKAEANSYFVNLNRDAYLSGVKVIITVTDEDENVTTHSVTTSADGFYYYNVGKDNLGAAVNIVAVTPSKDYSYTASDATSTSNYKFYNKNTILSASGLNTTLSSTQDQNFYLYFANCGFSVK
ncbi:MAG: hypothetical protein J6R35_02705 [Clostridia bacterium]|nr:hypothetical protein [Clostridia bacterium]